MADALHHDIALAGPARALHDGPLQSMFAAIMMLDGHPGDDVSLAVQTLREGARQLNEIIESFPA